MAVPHQNLKLAIGVSLLLICLRMEHFVFDANVLLQSFWDSKEFAARVDIVVCYILALAEVAYS